MAIWSGERGIAVRFNHYSILLFILCLIFIKAYGYDNAVMEQRADDLVYKIMNRTENKETENKELELRIRDMQSHSYLLKTSYLEEKSSKLKASHRLFVLVSFSMPDVLIKQYIAEAEKYGAILVIRGLIEDDFKKTYEKISTLVSNENKGGIVIDPILFNNYSINKVPAMLLTEEKFSCAQENCRDKKFDVIYGATSIHYALKRIASEGELSNEAGRILEGAL